MEKRTETGLVMGHAYGVTAVKKVQCNTMQPTQLSPFSDQLSNINFLFLISLGHHW